MWVYYNIWKEEQHTNKNTSGIWRELPQLLLSLEDYLLPFYLQLQLITSSPCTVVVPILFPVTLIWSLSLSNPVILLPLSAFKLNTSNSIILSENCSSCQIIIFICTFWASLWPDSCFTAVLDNMLTQLREKISNSFMDFETFSHWGLHGLANEHMWWKIAWQMAKKAG